MARPLRIEFPGAVYHVIARGIDGRKIFSSYDEKAVLRSFLYRIHDRYNFIFYAYCIMSNHYHLLLETPDANLSKGMQRLNGDYALWYNRKHARSGTLFQDRYKANLVEKETYLLTLSCYIALNPVRAGITDDPSSYRWSSYQDTMGMREPAEFLAIDFLLSMFSSDRREARRQYSNFVYQNMGKEAPEGINAGNVIGGADFIDEIDGYISEKREEIEITRKERFQNRLPLTEIFSRPEDRCIKTMRDEKIYNAIRENGYTQKEIADFLGMHYTSLSAIIRRKEQKIYHYMGGNSRSKM